MTNEISVEEYKEKKILEKTEATLSEEEYEKLKAKGLVRDLSPEEARKLAEKYREASKKWMAERRRQKLKISKPEMEFWEKLDRPQLAGKYKPFEIPEGKVVHKIEEDQGLKVTFVEKEHKQFWEGIGHPKYVGRYEPFDIPEGKVVKKIEETDEGITVIFVSPETAKFWISIGYPEYAEKYDVLEIPEGKHIKKVEETETGLQVTYTTEEAELFWAEMGHPEFSGKYEPFETPKGYQVKGIREEDGLKVAFEPTAEWQKLFNVLECGLQFAGLVAGKIIEAKAQERMEQQVAFAVTLETITHLPAAMIPEKGIAETLLEYKGPTVSEGILEKIMPQSPMARAIPKVTLGGGLELVGRDVAHCRQGCVGHLARTQMSALAQVALSVVSSISVAALSGRV